MQDLRSGEILPPIKSLKLMLPDERRHKIGADLCSVHINFCW